LSLFVHVSDKADKYINSQAQEITTVARRQMLVVEVSLLYDFAKLCQSKSLTNFCLYNNELGSLVRAGVRYKRADLELAYLTHKPFFVVKLCNFAEDCRLPCSCKTAEINQYVTECSINQIDYTGGTEHLDGANANIVLLALLTVVVVALAFAIKHGKSNLITLIYSANF